MANDKCENASSRLFSSYFFRRSYCEFLNARITSHRIEHRIDPEQRRMKKANVALRVPDVIPTEARSGLERRARSGARLPVDWPRQVDRRLGKADVLVS